MKYYRPQSRLSRSIVIWHVQGNERGDFLWDSDVTKIQTLQAARKCSRPKYVAGANSAINAETCAIPYLKI
jgi:hypothetical protein